MKKILLSVFLVSGCQEQFSITLANKLPISAVAPFSASTCPDGWTVFSAAQGRVVLGAGSGNIDANGGALTSRMLGVTGGRQITTGIAMSSGVGNVAIPAPELTLATVPLIYGPIAGDLFSGPGGDANLPPFVVQLYCKKISNTLGVPENISVATEASACGHWTSNLLLKGRTPLGSGSGNLDEDGDALSARVLLVSGGREYTTLSGTNTSIGGQSLSALNQFLGIITSGSLIYAYSSDTTFNGVKADSNMPPYKIVNYCSSGTTADLTIPSGSIVAFDLASCPTGWSAYSNGRGRVLFGAGAGNNDAEGTPLTNRILGAAGGLEYTTGVPANTTSVDNSPGGTWALGVETNMYVSTIPDTFNSGAIEDSNLPPYVALTYCKKD